jgi:hypothetical protein
MSDRRIKARVVAMILAAIIALVPLTGCSARYTPRIAGFQPGYEQERLGERTYQIRVGEAWPKDRPIIGKLALYRAAEITLENGFHYFSVLSSSDYETNFTLYSPGTSTSTTTASLVGGTLTARTTTVTTPGSATTIQGNWTYPDIRLVKREEVAGASNVIEAQKVIDDLKYFIERRR